MRALETFIKSAFKRGMTARTTILLKSKAVVHYINNVSVKNNNSKKKSETQIVNLCL